MILAAGLFGVAGGGCFSESEEEEATAGSSQVTEGSDTSAVLKSTLLLETGCTAAKIGPKLLLLSARCVAGNDRLAAGSTVKFVAAAAAQPGTPGTQTERSLVVSDVKIHSSYGAKCAGDACAVGKDASDAADVAVVLLQQELESVPSVPIDLDAVREADPILVVASGCASADDKPGAARTSKTVAVPAAAVNHEGSAYAGTTPLADDLGKSYLVTAGVGWQERGIKLCARDLGGPVFRGGAVAIVGVTSTYTLDTRPGADKLPMTIQHARVDAMSRFKIADWLKSFGARTLRSCSESAGGCQKRSYDGGLPAPPKETTGPAEDAGMPDVIAPPEDAGDFDAAAPRTAQVDKEAPPDVDPSAEDYGDAAVSSKKSKKKTGGCSASPASGGSRSLGLGMLVALGAVVARRRRSRG